MLALVVPAWRAGGQEPTSDETRSRGEWEVAPFVGYAQNSPVGTSWGVTPDRDHLFLGVHLATPVLRLGRVVLSYAPNVTPFVRLTNNPRYRDMSGPDGGPPIRVLDGRGPVYGAGLAPLGLQLRVPLHDRLAVQAGGAAGGLWFTRAVPHGNARAFNYTLEWGGALALRLRERSGLQVGYKFHHLSNYYSASSNPGVDGHVFYAGYSFRMSLPR